jgi:microcystin-dependent protein
MVDFNIKDGIDTLSSVNNVIPTGALVMKASAPSALSNYDTDTKCISAGFIPCDGRALNATTYNSYQELYDIIGNLYGGTNQNDFEVPDLRTSRRYIYGQSTVSGGVYPPSFSNNTTNTVTHSHSFSGNFGGNLSTNATAGTHTHSTSYTFSDGGSDYHSHYYIANAGGLNTGGALGTTLTKSDGTGTAAGAAHTHSPGGVGLTFSTGNGGASHSHSGSGTSDAHTEPTHTHTFSATPSVPVSSAIDIPYINVLYFIKL